MTDPHTDYLAASSTAACFDLTGRTQIEITGSDRAKFLHNFCTNDIKRLEAGNGCEAFVTNIKGRVLAHVFVFATDESLWLDSVAGAEDVLLPHLDRYLITEDAELTSRTEEFGELFVTGPQANDLLANANVDVNGLELCRQRLFETNNAITAVRRVDWLNQPGYLLLIARPHLDETQQLLSSAGVAPGTSDTFETLRIEAGFPRYGTDISDDNLAQEVGRTGQAISFTKGCYLGQEPIARIDAMGHVNRQLCRLKLANGPVPASGAELFATDDDKPVGHVTSAALSPADNLPVALGYLRTQFLAPDTKVFLDVSGEKIAATVVE